MYIPKDPNWKAITQFSPISLLNVEGKIFFSVMANRVMRHLMVNKYIDRIAQKGGVPDILVCLEHATLIWEANKKVKMLEKHDL